MMNFARPSITQFTSLLVSVAVVMSLIGCGGDSEKPLPSETTKTKQPVQFQLPNLVADVTDPAVAKAIRDRRQLLESSPTSAERWGELGMTLLAHDYFATAASCFAKAAELNPTVARWPYYEAIALQNDQPRQSIDRLRRAVELFPDEEQAAKLRLAKALIQQDHPAEAAELLRKVLAADSEHITARINLAKTELLQNRPQGCLDELAQLPRGDATRTELLLSAEALRRLGQIEEATRVSREAPFAIDAPTVDPHFLPVSRLKTGLKAGLDTATQLLTAGRTQESIELAEQLVIHYPTSEWAHITLGRGLIRIRRLADAERALNKALEINGNSYEALFRMAVAKHLQQEHKQAATWYLKTVERHPNAAVAHKNLGQCLIALGDFQGAEKSFQDSVIAQPNYLDGHLALASLYAKQQRPNLALAALRDAQRLKPNDPAIEAAIERLERSLR